MRLLIVVIISGLLSFLISLWIRDTSRKWGMLDIPNPRSSHVQPTPKGGGIGIAVGITAGYIVSHSIYWPMSKTSWMILTGSLSMALLGYFSDRSHLPPLARILVQALIAFFVIGMIGHPENLDIVTPLQLGSLGFIFSAIWLLAITNFYNFMDGIDGLAAMQAIVAGLAIAFFGILLRREEFIPTG